MTVWVEMRHLRGTALWEGKGERVGRAGVK
jgi:hypothetical protein